MEALDHLITLARIEGRLDLRCLLRGPLEIDHASEPSGVSAYHIVLSGQCVLRRSGTQDVTLAAGDVALLPRGRAHVIIVEGDGGPVVAPTTHFNGVVMVRSNTSVNPPGVDLLCGRFGYATPTALIDALPDLITVRFADAMLEMVVNTMRREASAPQPGAQAIVGAMSTALFAMTLRVWLARSPELSGVLALLSSRRVSQAVIAMLEHPGEPWTLALLAERAAMSRSSFMRSYAALAPEPPLQFLGRIRMQLASRLLTQSPRKIGDIAAEVGYASETAFAKKFKELFDSTPAQYRRECGHPAALTPLPGPSQTAAQ